MNIYLSSQKQAGMDQCLGGAKEPKFVICQETGEASTEKLISNVGQDHSGEFKLQKIGNLNGIFQITSVVLSEEGSCKRGARANFKTGGSKLDPEYVNGKKFKVEGRQKKPKKLTQFSDIFKSYTNFLSQPIKPIAPTSLFEYCQRRTVQNTEGQANKIDLGVYNTRQLLELCGSKNLISIEVYAEYSYQDNFILEDKFIWKLNQQKYEELHMGKMYFTVFDHRMLCTLLVGLFPQEFLFPRNVCMDCPLLTNFYTFLYSLSEEEYWALYDNLNIKLNRNWMPTNLPSFQQLATQKLSSMPKWREKEKEDQDYPFCMPPRKLRRKH